MKNILHDMFLSTTNIKKLQDKCCLKSIFNIEIFSLLHIKCKFLSESNVLHTVMLFIKLGFNFDNIVVLQ
jgi:hypothetical protein